MTRRNALPWLAIAATLTLMVVQLRVQGRLWRCEMGDAQIWVAQPAGSHTSQHVADPYSLTHVEHGLALYWLLAWLAPRRREAWRMWLALAIEAGWEIVENTKFVIDRYRDATAALGYTGDAIINSVGDFLACWLGLVIARQIGWRWTIALLLAIELLLVVTIRDSLLLSILMLLAPIEAVKDWQLR